MVIKQLLAGLGGSLLVVVGMPLSATAASNIVVTPTNQQGWTSSGPLADTRPGGAVNFITDSTAPAGSGALQLTTNATTTAKAQYLHATNTPLSSVSALSYYTKQVSAPFAGADPSYQLETCLTGVNTTDCNKDQSLKPQSSFTTLVFEPYQNPSEGTVTNGAWQKWDVAAGLFWSTHTVVCSNGTIVGTSGGPASYTLAQIKTACPNALTFAFGLNVGTNNPNYNVESDLFNFNATTYDFEPTVGPPTNEDQCENAGWKKFNTPSFKSAEQCENFVRKHSHSAKGDVSYTAFGLLRHAEFSMSTTENEGNFEYSDANHDWYKVKISSIKVNGDSAYFAGVVTYASNPSWVGQWLFAKVQDNSPDKIWGDFTTQTVAESGVASMTNPPSGPFDVTKGNIEVK